MTARLKTVDHLGWYNTYMYLHDKQVARVCAKVVKTKKRPHVEVTIQTKRIERAHAVMAKYLPILTEDEVLELAMEIGLFECLSYTKTAKGFIFDFTDIQTLAFAAALAGVGETLEGIRRG